MKDDHGQRLLSCRQAAEAYGCSMNYIRRLARLGRIRSEIVGGTYFVRADEVRKMAARKTTGREKKRSSGFRPD